MIKSKTSVIAVSIMLVALILPFSFAAAAGDVNTAQVFTPIVFVHGYVVHEWEWDIMIDRFAAIGYPEDYLAPVRFDDSIGSNVVNARDTLPDFAAGVLERTGADKVDVIAHSMGGLSSRLWIKFYGGADLVRDYVSVSGTHHGSRMGFFVQWLGEGGAEQYPAYADQAHSHNSVQWDLNGDPDSADVDETPFGVEEGGEIYWNALWSESDELVIPPRSSCLNQGFRNDCSDPANLYVPGVRHFGMVYDAQVFEISVCSSPDADEQTVISYSRDDGCLALDVSNSSLSPDFVGREEQRASLGLATGEALKLRLFLDRSIVEVFANSRLCLTKRIYPSRPDSLGVRLSARGGTTTVRSMDVWQMTPVWPTI